MVLRGSACSKITLSVWVIICISLLSAVAFAACGGQSADTHGSRTYLEEVRPACVKLPGSINEPCARRLPWRIETYPNTSPTYAQDLIEEYPISVEEEMRRSWSSGGISTPQIILRGTVLPGSARCEPVMATIWERGRHFMSEPESPREACYVDVWAGEYVVGRGPERLTILAGWKMRADTRWDDYGTPEYYSRLAGPIRSSMEGIEFIFQLVHSSNLAHGEWSFNNAWDVQLRKDGTVVGVSHWIRIFGTEETWSDFEYPLPELQATMKRVHSKIASEMGGRIGRSASSPMLVTDAHRDELLGQLRQLGGYDVPGVTPIAAPPAPIPPIGPTELTALLPDDGGGIPLSWSASPSDDVTGYKVVRRVPKGDFVTVVADTGSTETTYTDTSAPMTAGVTYIYRVLALNEYGESLASNRATVELPGPDAPTDFKATYRDGDVVLTWTQPGVIMPSCYRIYRRAQGEQSFEWVVNCWSAELRSWRDDDVVSGTRYIYRIVPMIGYTESGATARASIRVR